MNPAEAPYTLSRWSLNDLLPAGGLETALKQLQADVADFETLRPRLSPEMPEDDFLAALHRLESLNRQAHLLYSHASLSFAADTQDQSAQTTLTRLQQVMAETSNRTLFFDLWWKALEEAPAARLMAAAGDLRYWLEEMRHFKPYTLSEPEEKVINLKDVTGSGALNLLYNAITNRYTFNLEVEGVKRALTRGELMVFARHPDAALRRQAYAELNRVYGADASILGQIYQSLVRDWRNEQVGLRGFASPLAVRNLSNDIPDAVVDTLLEVCQANAGIFQRFFRLKAARLGMERLGREDIYAPAARSERKLTYPQAAALVLEAYRGFDPRLGALVRRMLESCRVDSEVRPGKQSGAFCLTAAPDLTPWVLLNFQGRAEDAATMAHEFGHAIHSMLAAGHSILTFHPSLPLAETASTFGEMVLVEHLLQGESDAGVRRELLFRQVDDAYATILRQAFFALFEKQAHEMAAQGAAVDDLSKAYLENLRRQFGDAVEVDEAFRNEWVSIPHIFQSPFYVYAYSFGQLLVLSLYRQYRQEGEAFKPRYFDILAAGGSQAPARLLLAAGMDITRADFWQGGLDVIEGWVELLEGLEPPA